ncbi:phosphopantetheine-binding protein [Pseudodesulfovibrio sediminis]|uniref:Acyl carrier protein n=1 Tax=Pseudodesulfovibrio sediminis TaxID=2810563 RepID=A0ABM8HWV4_9BACT|nr:phosphopantetheine-binding protein [Pseudodesulfovibrio sediminis]BCS88437.1 acyl carrier protein [Pseudodesulfovibrio sediminis]
MTDSEITAVVDKLLIEEFELEPDQLKPEALFKDDLDLDSLDAVDMVIILEQEFKFKVKKDTAFRAIRSLGDLHAYVLQKKSEM